MQAPRSGFFRVLRIRKPWASTAQAAPCAASRLAPLVLAFALAGCGTASEKSDGLYSRLGGSDGIAKIVAGLLVNVRKDARIRDRFKAADLPRLEQRLNEQLCAVSGGECRYEGRGMADAHQGMKISAAEFDAFLGDLAKSLDEHGIGARAQRELLFALKAMQPEVMAIGD